MDRGRLVGPVCSNTPDSRGHHMMKLVEAAYGRPALDAMRDAVGAAKGGDPMAPVLLLTGSNIAGIVARRHLARHGVPMAGGATAGIAGIEVSTLARLAERLAAPALAPRRPTTGPVLVSAWRAALTEQPGIFAEVADHVATARALADSYRELRDLDDEAIARVAAGSAITDDVVRLYRSVRAALAPGWYDTRDLLDTATTLLGARPETRPVVLLLPTDLTPAETRLLAALGVRTSVTVICGTTNIKRADDHLAPLRTLAGTPDLSPSVDRPTASAVRTASDSDDEVRGAVREVVRALREGTPAHRIAVLYSAHDPYARLLHEHFAAAGITVNGPGAKPVAERSVARFLLTLLSFEPDGIPRADLFRALAEVRIRTTGGATVPVTQWERISRAAGVVRGADWDQRLEHYFATERARAVELDAEERTGAASAARRAADEALDLRDFVGELRTLLDAGRSVTTWHALGVWCADLFTGLVGSDTQLQRLPREEQHAAATILTLLSGLGVLDEIGGQPSIELLREILGAELERARPRVGRFGDGVLVAPVAQAVGLDLDVVHVLGLSEDLYPGRPSPNAVLPEEVRDAVDGLRTTADELGTSYRNLLAAFACAPASTASFPRGDLRSSSARLPSRFLLGTLRALAGRNELAASEWETVGSLGGALVSAPSFAGELMTTSELATELEWRVRRVVRSAYTDDVIDLAEVVQTSRESAAFTRFDGNLAGVVGLPDYATSGAAISATALEAYASCPHSYFVQRLLRIEPVEEPETLVQISAMEIGNLIHESMDQLVQELGDNLPGHGEPWTVQHRRRLLEIADERAAQMEAGGLTGHPRLWRREKQRIHADLVAMLDDDSARRATRAARVVASELRFGTKGQPPVAIPVSRGTVHMRGSADKVDLGSDGTIYVVDIKTGGTSSYKDIKQEDPLAGATRYQLPLYGMAARAHLGTPDAPVTAEYWFVRKFKGKPGQLGTIGIEIDGDVEAALRDAVDLLVESIRLGRFPARPPVGGDYGWVRCRVCNPDAIGYGTAPERWERKRRDPALRELVALLEPTALDDGGGA